MRIDQYLKKTLIVKQRETANELCAKGMVKVNNILCKPSKTVKPGDVIEIETMNSPRRYRVLEIPEGNVRRDQTGGFYEELPS